MENDQELDSRKMYFDSGSAADPILMNIDTYVFACQRAHAVNNQCTYSVCKSCWEKGTKGEVDENGVVKRRKRNVGDHEKPERIGSVTPQSLKAVKCHHEIDQLTQLTHLHWCAPNLVGKAKWFEGTTGCRKCEKMYLFCRGTGSRFIKNKDEWDSKGEVWRGFPSLNDMDEFTRNKYEKWKKSQTRLFP